MTVEANTKVVRVTTGLDAASYLDTEMVDLMSWDACYVELRNRFHPQGLRCRCGQGIDNAIGNGRSRTGYPRFKCRACHSTFSLLSGTIFSGCTLDASRLLLFMRMIADGRGTAVIAAAVGVEPRAVQLLSDKVRVYGRTMETAH